jgi:hypothetical protein
MMRLFYSCLLFLFLTFVMSTAFAQESQALSALPPDGFRFTGGAH